MLRHIRLLLGVLITALSLSALPATAQKSVSASRQTEMVKTIAKASSSITSMDCDFTQTKRMSILGDQLKAKGRMYFNGGKQLRWEYTSPYTYVFIVNGTKVLMRDAKKSNVVDAAGSKLFTAITRIMMGSVTGQCLSSSSDFKVRMLDAGSEWRAVLTPQKKELSQLFSTITLHYDVAKKLVTQVDMVEKSGDSTTIVLTNIKKNAPVSSSLFSVH